MKQLFTVFIIGSLMPISTLLAQTDSSRVARSYSINEIVVTGTRNETDIRHLPMTISVVGRQQLEQNYQPSVLPTLTEQVPGLFTTSRGMMGYGVSGGAAGGMSLRGIGGGVGPTGGPTTGLLVLIDGHPQYMGLMGHPIADAYQTMMTERVEVLRGPASVLYGSNAMGHRSLFLRCQKTSGAGRLLVLRLYISTSPCIGGYSPLQPDGLYKTVSRLRDHWRAL